MAAYDIPLVLPELISRQKFRIKCIFLVILKWRAIALVVRQHFVDIVALIYPRLGGNQLRNAVLYN